MEQLRIVPPAASNFATQVDLLIWAFTLLSIFFTVLIATLVIVFSVRYRKGAKVNRVIKSPDNTALELTWTILPTFLALAFFCWSAYLFFDFKRMPEGAMEIQVIGKQWMWKAQHPNGRREVNTLHVPKGQPVRLIMTSQDVIHSFFIPAFRAKMDVLPGSYTQMWFEPNKVGSFRLYCAEYCGTEHALMGGWVHVLEPEDYQRWLTEGNVRLASAGTPQAAGEQLFAAKGCAQCHSGVSGARGPDLAGAFGSKSTLQDGSEVLVDEDYIRESILYPQAKLVQGYAPLMPTFKNQLREEEIMNLISYIKSLSDMEG